MSSRKAEQGNEAIRKNVEKARQRIRHACELSGRDPETVRILLMTKSVPVATVRQVLEMEENLIGEKNESELKEKLEKLDDHQLEVHFLGSLLQGKYEDVLDHIDCVQTLDRYDIACEMNDYLKKIGRKLDVLIQVNTSFGKNRRSVEHTSELQSR